MRSKSRSALAMLALSIPLLGSVSGCTQADNPTPEKAAPPPAPKPEELKVGKTDASGKEYGSNDRYKKAMERLNKAGGN